MQVLNIFHVLVAIAMVAFILVQRGPGATAGAAFGSGASGTVFGSRGAGSFLSRSTWILATLFCLISLVMAVIVSRDLSAPETDLGVVGRDAPAVEAPLESEPSTPVMGDPDTDLPSPGIEALSPAADDLPALEPEATESEAVEAADEDEATDS
ncbi:preprotein translocase subunit SecG [Marinihelvus fidelis]|uniref:Protein-export membrane protein SecG n=1 Tax=Marinihelvus fidelis TaxID=2613842 RepID=A0A5N0T5P0_9GAMM|nr:preprotein translocase subunit SecG [Marinihelvus fidelis]KAA9130253.1 preprotein translocase subunit SecG [Marinihelvus fidelis]